MIRVQVATHASRVAALEADFASVQAEFQGAHADEARIRWTFRERLPTLSVMTISQFLWW